MSAPGQMTPAMADYLRKLRDDGPQFDAPEYYEGLIEVGIPDGGWHITSAGLEALEQWETENA